MKGNKMKIDIDKLIKLNALASKHFHKNIQLYCHQEKKLILIMH